MRIPRVIGFVLIGIYLSQIVFYYPKLPEYMASNFDGSGNPQAWMSKELFFLVGILCLLIPFLVFLFLPKILRKTPEKYLSIPNKDYWLADERKEATIERVTKYYEWIFAGIMAFSIIVSQMVIQANIGEEKRLSDYFILALIAFFIYIIALIIGLFLSFKKPG